MTHKQSELRWRLKYEFLEKILAQIDMALNPNDTFEVILNNIRKDCENYLTSQGITYPTKASDK